MSVETEHLTCDGETLPISNQQRLALSRLLTSATRFRAGADQLEQALIAVDLLPQTLPGSSVDVTFVDESALYTASVVVACSMSLSHREASFTQAETFVGDGVGSDTSTQIVFECSADGWMEGSLDDWIDAVAGAQWTLSVSTAGFESFIDPTPQAATPLENEERRAAPLSGQKLPKPRGALRLILPAIAVLVWAAVCGVRYWLAAGRASDCEWYLTHAPARSEVAGSAMRCYADAIGARDAALMMALIVPLGVAAAAWLMLAVMANRRHSSPGMAETPR